MLKLVYSAAGGLTASRVAATPNESSALRALHAPGDDVPYWAPVMAPERAWVLMHILYELRPLLNGARLRRARELADGCLRLTDLGESAGNVAQELRLRAPAAAPFQRSKGPCHE